MILCRACLIEVGLLLKRPFCSGCLTRDKQQQRHNLIAKVDNIPVHSTEQALKIEPIPQDYPTIIKPNHLKSNQISHQSDTTCRAYLSLAIRPLVRLMSCYPLLMLIHNSNEFVGTTTRR